MSEKISKDGNKITMTEYEFRPIDEYGDSTDVQHFETKSKAIAAAKSHVTDGGLAAAVEKHVSKRPAHLFGAPDVFTTLAVFGDKAALELWGWQPGESTWLEN